MISLPYKKTKKGTKNLAVDAIRKIDMQGTINTFSICNVLACMDLVLEEISIQLELEIKWLT